MRPCYIAALLIISCVTTSFADSDFLSIPENFASIQEGIGYDINVTLSLWNSSNFLGLLYTTQQFDSVFPSLLANTNPPQNVSFHVFSHINPFTILNFTKFHLTLDFVIQVTVLLEEASGVTPFTNFNITGYVDLELYSVSASFGYRLYLKDYSINDIVVSQADTAKVNKQALLDTLQNILQLYIQPLNHKLAQKNIFLPHDDLIEYLLDDPSSSNNFLTVDFGDILS